MLYFCILLPLSLIKLPRPDIVIGSSVHPFGSFVSYYLSRYFSIPFIFEVRDLWPETLLQMKKINKSSLIYNVLHWIEKYLYRNSSLIISVLPKGFEYIDKYSNSVKVFHLPNGVDLGLYPTVKYKSSTFKSCNLNHLNCIFTGSLVQSNCLDRILESFKILKDKGLSSKFTLEIYGDGPLKSFISKYISDNKLSNVHLNKPVPKDKLNSLYLSSDLCIICNPNLPELYKYGLSPNKLFDYMASSRLVLISTPSITPIINNFNGIVVSANTLDLSNGLQKALDLDREKYIKMTINARQTVVNEFSFEYLASSLNSEMRSLLP
tara:strand:- start:938 stop:1903 length:966 start_codon:yes stop_codon:yes gene_type:complete